MANENGVNVQEKANDVELIELSEDEEMEDSKISATGIDSKSAAKDEIADEELNNDAAGPDEDGHENGDKDDELVAEECLNDEVALEADGEVEEGEVEQAKNGHVESVEDKDFEMKDVKNDEEERSVPETISLADEDEEELEELEAPESMEEDVEESQDSIAVEPKEVPESQVDELEDESQPSQAETTDSVPESKTSDSTSVKDTIKPKLVETITLESDDDSVQEIASQAQDLSKKKTIEEVLPVSIPPELSGFPSFFNDVINIGVTYAINRKNRNNIDIDEESSILDCPSQVVPLILKKMTKFPKKLESKESPPPLPQASQKNMLTISDFYTSSAGKFLMGIGLSRVKQHFHRDVISKVKRQIRKEGEASDLVDELKKQQEYYGMVRTANLPYTFPLDKCEHCDFKTEFKNVMAHHLMYPHMTSRKEYKCNHCQFSCRDPKIILNHVISLHQTKCKIEQPPHLYECPICPFETGVKSKAGTHIARCLKGFVPERLLFMKDDVYPAITPKPITQEDIKIYEATLQALRVSNQKNLMPGGTNHGMNSASRQKQIKPRQSLPPNPHTILNRLAPNVPSPSPATASAAAAAAAANNLNLSNLFNNISMKNISPQLFQMLTGPGASSLLQNPQIAAAAAQLTASGLAPNFQQLLKNQTQMLNARAGMNNSAPGASATSANLLNAFNKNTHTATPPQMKSQSIISKKPKQQPPQMPSNAAPMPPNVANVLSGDKHGQLFMCEICDVNITDVEQLRTHMHWIHKVKIHPKMLQNRPPLNCQKCQWRFFTDQGLERHLLGSHGLVTTNMQELVGLNKDGGRCTICGRVYNNKLVSHMNLFHKINLKPAHLSYKCTVCSATFNLYRLFESHVYLVHSNGGNKRGAGGDGGDAASGTADAVSKKKVARIENGN